MSRTKNTMNNMGLCGLYGAHVSISVHNTDGKCQCLNCKGAHCAECDVFKVIQAHNNWSDMMDLPSRCAKCRACEKQR